ncbi:MAG: type IV toxin-antitoxin system AbiEi family antitoxin domain-containing protein [Kiritimatiellia bacterium]
MNWHLFKSNLFALGCFSVHQVYAWQPGFDRNNLSRWLDKGYLLRLRRGLYTFPDYLGNPDMAAFFAGAIYKPSYISLHHALAFYGLIPESVSQITSVTSRKTADFSNAFGSYSYKSVRPDLMFGYILQPLADGRSTAFASREKALLDLLYLYPFYNTEEAMADLRLDENVLHADVNRSEWDAFVARFCCTALERRAQLLTKVYAL